MHLEHYSSPVFLYGARDVQPFRTAAKRMDEVATSAPKSAEFIALCAKELEDQQ